MKPRWISLFELPGGVYDDNDDNDNDGNGNDNDIND